MNLQTTIAGQVTVRNTSAKPLPAFHIRFYIADAPPFDRRLSILLQQVTVPALKANESCVAELSAPLATGDDDSGYTIYAMIDPEHILNDPASGTTAPRVVP